ncbi:MAG: hypothetical protein SGPRY_005150 [Prymnesium sp.]
MANHSRWRVGYCGVTRFSSSSVACEGEGSGAWHLSPSLSPSDAKRRCLARCVACRSCRFVSIARGECSWFSECSIGKLHQEYAGFETAELLLPRPPEKRRSIRKSRTVNTSLPSLLLFYHMPKTGGTTFRALMQTLGVSRDDIERQRSPTARLPRLISSDCLLSLFPELWAYNASSRLPCGAKQMSWHVADMAVEFHYQHEMEHWWKLITPALPQLRLLYAAHKGKVITATLVRHPTTMMASHYKMWPPRVPAQMIPHATDRPHETIRGVEHTIPTFNEALTMRFSESCTYQSSLVKALVTSKFSCSRSQHHQDLARERLRGFDVLGITDCFRQFCRLLGAELPWLVFHSESILTSVENRLHNEWYKPHEMDSSVRAFVEASVDEVRSPDAADSLQRVLDFDGPLYLDALQRAGVDFGDEAVAPGEEHAWLSQVLQMPLECAP